jgi:hypothetical protein
MVFLTDKSTVSVHMKVYHSRAQQDLVLNSTDVVRMKQARDEGIQWFAAMNDGHGVTPIKSWAVNKRVATLKNIDIAQMNREIRILCMFAACNIPFGAADDQFFRDFSPINVGEVPVTARNISNRALNIVFAKLCSRDEVLLHTAPAVSLAADCWVSLGGEQDVLGIMHSFVDADFQPRMVALDFVPICARHSASTLARLMAARTDSHTLATQLIYGTKTDQVANIIAAAKLLLTDDVEREFDGDEIHDMLHNDSNAADAFADELNIQNDDAAVAADEVVDNDDDDLAEQTVLDARRVSACVDHQLSLLYDDVLRGVPEFASIVKTIDRTTSAVVHSNLRKKILAKVFEHLGEQPVRLLRRNPTRWYGIIDVIERFFKAYRALCIMFAKGVFHNVSAGGEPLTLISPSSMRTAMRIARDLSIIACMARQLEGSTYFTTPFVPLMVLQLAQYFGERVDDVPLRLAVREVVVGAIDRRFVDIMKPSSPYILAMALHPITSHCLPRCIKPEQAQRVLEEVSHDDLLGCLHCLMSHLAEWYSFVEQAHEDRERADANVAVAAGAGPQQPPGLMRAILREMNGEVNVPREEARVIVQNAAIVDVRHLLEALAEYGEAQRAAVDQLLNNDRDRNVIKGFQDHVATFYHQRVYGRVDSRKFDAFKRLVRTVLSMPASSAAVEQMFSVASLIDTPRNRIVPGKFEKLTILARAIQDVQRASMNASEEDKKKLLAQFYETVLVQEHEYE